MNNTISAEDMASFEVLHTQNHGPDSFPSEEYSFLPDVTAGSIPNGDINHHMSDNFDLTNMQSALGSTIPSTSEVQSQLLEIIEENKSLKEKLNKNNAMMKEQMTTITAWRADMLAVKDQLQGSLVKAKERISTLEEENAKLSERLNQTSNANKEEKAPSCEKCSVFDGALNNMLAIDSFENTESLLLELSYFREQLLPNLMKLCSFIQALVNSTRDEEDRKLLKTFVLLLQFKIAALEGGNSSATSKTDEETGYEVVDKKTHENTLELRLAIEDLKKVLDEKQAELCCLKKDKDELREKLEVYENKIQDLEMALKSKFEVMNNKLDIESSLSEKYKERCESLQQQLQEYQVRLDKAKMSDDDVVNELRENIQNLQDILKLEQEANQDAKNKLAQVMLKCEKLQVDYDRVSKLLELELEKNKEIATLKESEAKEFLSKIDELTAQFFEMEEQKRECDGRIRSLEGKLSEIEDQANDIPLFKQQIEAYEKDYRNVKEAYEKAIEEAEQLRTESKKPEKKCDSCACACNGSTSRKQRNGRSPSDSKEQNKGVLECPFCAEKFTNESNIHRHIYRSHTDDA